MNCTDLEKLLPKGPDGFPRIFLMYTSEEGGLFKFLCYAFNTIIEANGMGKAAIRAGWIHSFYVLGGLTNGYHAWQVEKEVQMNRPDFIFKTGLCFIALVGFTYWWRTK
jgi:hypothetical protein